MFDQQSVLEPLRPVFPSMASWVLGGKEELDAKFTTPDEQVQFDNGPGLNFYYIQRMARSI